MRDYRERRQVPPNRPRGRQGSGKLFFLALAIPPIVTFALGIGSGWWLSMRYGGKNTAAPQVASSPAAQPTMPLQPLPPGTQAPPLTFFETLPKGNAVLGTGINLPKNEGQPVSAPPSAPAQPTASASAQPPAQSAPAAPQAGVPAVPATPRPTPAAKPASPAVDPAKQPLRVIERLPGPPTAPAGPSAAKGKFTVQVASYASKEEAEALRSRLSGKGFQAHLSELTAGKVTWYRVRVGRGMEAEQANHLAAKVGNGAIVVLD